MASLRFVKFPVAKAGSFDHAQDRLWGTDFSNGLQAQWGMSWGSCADFVLILCCTVSGSSVYWEVTSEWATIRELRRNVNGIDVYDLTLCQ
jgi:hypothetical protein